MTTRAYNVIINLYNYEHLECGGVMKKQIREVRLVDLAHYLLLPLVLILAIVGTVALTCHWFGDAVRPIYFILFGVLLSLFTLRHLAIGLVLLYKAIAPMSLRDRCRFEPCCSTYMIMALQKYGLVVGLYKGIRRICRCHPPNGGEDLP